MDKYDELLLNEDFSTVEDEIKELLDDDASNSRLWYLLFLAQNNNYVDCDFDNLRNELAFNKAVENSTIREEINYKIEFELYKNINQFMHFAKFFRYYQCEKYDECFMKCEVDEHI